jgi:hypothetical protein
MADNEFEPGSMNVDTQEKTFAGFMRWVSNATIAIIFILIFMLIFAR